MTRNCYKILNNSHPIVTVKTLEKEDADHVMIINAYNYQQKWTDIEEKVALPLQWASALL